MADRTNYYVYVLFRENGSPFYVGKGHGRRWLMHETAYGLRHKTYRTNIIRDMLTRGVEIPKIKLHEGLTNAVACEYETTLIAALGRHPHGPLANLTDGGEGASGYVHQPDALARMSALKRGKPRSPEAIAKQRLATKGKPKPHNFGAKIAAAKLGKPLPQKHRANVAAGKLGIKASAEARAKMSATRRGKKRPPFSPEWRAKLAAAAVAREARRRYARPPAAQLALNFPA